MLQRAKAGATAEGRGTLFAGPRSYMTLTWWLVGRQWLPPIQSFIMAPMTSGPLLTSQVMRAHGKPGLGWTVCVCVPSQAQIVLMVSLLKVSLVLRICLPAWYPMMRTMQMSSSSSSSFFFPVICHAATCLFLSYTLGIGKASQCLREFDLPPNLPNHWQLGYTRTFQSIC